MDYFIKRVVVIILLTFLSQNVFSQRYFIKYYDIENGLPTRMVSDICQDTSGLIWMATSEGISCYDGFKFNNFNSKDGLPEQKYKRIKSDTRGILWALPVFVSDTLITYENNEIKRIIPVHLPLPLTETNDFDVLYEDNKPVVCVGSDLGVFLYKNNSWTQIIVSDDPVKNTVTRVIADKDKFYLVTGTGICILINNILSWDLNNKISPYVEDIINIEFENKGTAEEKLWVLSRNSIGYFSGNEYKTFLKNLELPDFTIRKKNSFIKLHSKGKIFVGNNFAKYYIDKPTGKVYPLLTVNGFSSDGALSIFIDKEGNIWFADTRGVNKFNRLSLMNHYEINGLLENEVTATSEMNDGKFVFGHNKGLSILDNDYKIKRILFNADHKTTARVHDMFKDREGNVWFAASMLGVGKLSADGKIKWYKKNKDDIYFSVQQDVKGKIWIGALSGINQLYYIENDNLVEYKHSHKIDNLLRKLFPSDKGGLYLVGIRGLWYADEKGVKKYSSPDGVKADNVYSYYKSRDGVEFVGTSAGLYFIQNEELIKYDKKGLNIKNPVYFILQDNEGFYWFGTNDGVLKWDGSERVEKINTNSGLAGHETNRSAGLLDSKGNVWIGTDLGLSCFKQEYNRKKIQTPKLLLYNLEDSKGIQYHLNDNLSVPYIDNTLIFNFRGISFENEDLIVYRYKLEGYDKDWQEIHQSMLDKVKYVNVSPGEYTFCVMAKNFSGEWSDVKKSGLVKINLPFYKSWWFIALIFIVFGGMVVLLVKINDQKVRNEKLESEIANRKRIEQELNESKIKYQDIVDLLPESVFETDLNGNFTYVNNFGLNLLEFTQEDFEKSVNIKSVMLPEDYISFVRNTVKLLRNREVNSMQYTCLTKFGRKVPLSINAVPMLRDGKVIGIRGVAMDMTEHKKANETLIKYADDLKELNASKDKFFSIVAHDLKNPFQGLLGFSDFLHNDYNTLTEAEKIEYIGYIRTSSKIAYNLLDNLLQWSRLQTGRIEVLPSRLNLFTELKSVLGLFASNAVRKKINVINNIDSGLYVTADSNMLNSVLQNLVSNAIKFTGQNGEIKVNADVKDNFVYIKISDNGIGISKEEINKLFKIDNHVSGIGTMQETGTGLGLILCKEMVELNGGTIFAESEKGSGSTFTFTVPLS